MTTDIFLRSYAKDIQWLPYLFKSIEKHCSGFRRMVVVVPEQDVDLFKRTGFTGDKLIGVKEPTGASGYMCQQIDKLNAHQYTDSTHALFVDSDTCFIRPCSPEMFFIEEKPYMLITPYEALGDAVPWQPITEKALKIKCPYETMRRLPFFYPVEGISQLKNYMGTIHKRPMEDYILSQPHNAFSEFNALGSFMKHFYPNSFYWWDTTKEPNLPQPFVKQNWSWGGMSAEQKRELEVLTA